MSSQRTAVLIYEDKRVLQGGYILQGRIWLVPEPVAGSSHRFKYSLFLGRPGERLVLYDNERGKGNHRHLRDREEPYTFRGVQVLLEDFRNHAMQVLGGELRPDGDT